MAEDGFRARCWCSGRKQVWFSTDALDRSCHGQGYLRCLCGGDFCVCHNHGEVECVGCLDCEYEPDDDWPYDPEEEDPNP